MFTNDDFDTFKHFHISENPEEEKVIVQRMAALKAGAHPSLRNDKRKSLKRHKQIFDHVASRSRRRF